MREGAGAVMVNGHHRVRTNVCDRAQEADARVILCSRTRERKSGPVVSCARGTRHAADGLSRRQEQCDRLRVEQVLFGAHSASVRWIIAGFIPRKFATSIFGKWIRLAAGLPLIAPCTEM